MTRRPWTSTELKLLSKVASLGAEACTDAINEFRASKGLEPRTVQSIKATANRRRLSLRRPGVKRGRSSKGLILGQPVNGIPAEALADFNLVRNAVISEGFDIAAAEARVAAEVRGELDLCPTCCARPVQKRSTGLCEICHWKHLAQAQRERVAAQQAERDYKRLNKQADRRVECALCGNEYSPRKEREGRNSDRRICPSCRKGA